MTTNLCSLPLFTLFPLLPSDPEFSLKVFTSLNFPHACGKRDF